MDVQSHIHLSKTLSGAPEYSPDMKWKVRVEGWMFNPYTVSDHRRTLTGHLKVHTLKTSGGEIKRFSDNKYILRVDEYWGMTGQERLDALVAMQSEQVYLIDVLHSEDDDQNHSGSVRTMHMNLVTDITPINPQLAPLYVSVELVDADSVT